MVTMKMENLRWSYVASRQCLECEDCDDKSTVKGDLKVHEEVPHEEVIGSNYWLHCSQEQYYDFYEDCDEKSDSTENVIANTDNENLDHEHVIGVIVIGAFLAPIL